MLKRLLLPLLLLPFILGCPGLAVDKFDHGPPPPGGSLILQIFGPNQMVAGEQWAIVSAVRSTESSELIHWFLEGPGTLSNPLGSPNPPNEGLGQEYLPPGLIPSGGSAQAKIYYKTKDPFTGVIQKSPEILIRLETLKEPMRFTSSSPPESSMTGGEIRTLVATPYPVPAGFTTSHPVRWELRTNPQVADPGTYTFRNLGPPITVTGMDYQAPAVPLVDFDVIITATMHDPWFNLDPVLNWTIHVKKP